MDADTLAPAVSPLRITGDSIVAEPGGVYLHDFGAMDPGQAGNLVEDFSIRNVSAAPVVIVNLAPSCHCTTATMRVAGSDEMDPTVRSPAIIAAGASATVHVVIQPEDVSPGSYTQSVTIQTSPEQPPPTVLELRFTVRAPVSFTPPVLNAGRIAAGSGATLQLTANIDRAIVGGDAPPKLISSNPDITITQTGYGPEAITYIVTVSTTAAAGPLIANLSYAPNISGESDDSPWSAARAVVFGVVTGDVEADPAAIAFGIVAVGARTPAKTLTLTGPAGELTGASVKSPGPWLTAILTGLQAAGSGNSPGACTLTLSLDAEHLARGLNAGNVLVTLKNGERVNVPATAFCAVP